MEIWPFSAIPAGFLLCDGSSYLDTDIPTLAALLRAEPGGIFVVDATHVKVPDMRDRFPLGYYSAVSSIGQAGGSRSISVAQMPAHTHPFNVRFTSTTTATANLPRVTDVDGLSGGGGSSGTANPNNAGSGADYLPKHNVVNYIIKT